MSKLFYVLKQTDHRCQTENSTNYRIIGVYNDLLLAISSAQNPFLISEPSQHIYEDGSSSDVSIKNRTKTLMLIFSYKINDVIPRLENMNIKNLVWWSPYGIPDLISVLPNMFPKEIKNLIAKYCVSKKPILCSACHLFNLPALKIHTFYKPTECINCSLKKEREYMIKIEGMLPKLFLCPLGSAIHNRRCKFAHEKNKQETVKDDLTKSPMFKIRLCDHFKYGRCLLGKNCINAHDRKELQYHPEIDPNELIEEERT